MIQLKSYHIKLKYQDHQMVNIRTLSHIKQFRTTKYQTYKILIVNNNFKFQKLYSIFDKIELLWKNFK